MSLLSGKNYFFHVIMPNFYLVTRPS